MKKRKEASLHKRYGAKLISHIIIGAIGIIIQAIIPRALGPAQYGTLSFLTATFNRVTAFLELGSSSCFYTKLSQRPKEFGLILFYAYFAVVITVLFGVFLIIVSITGAYSLIWPNQAPFFLYLAGGLAILLWGKKILQSILDAYALTVASEIVQVFQSVIILGIVVGLFLLDKLTLTQVFVYNYIVTVILGFAFVLIAIKSGRWKNAHWKLKASRARKYFWEFYHYAHPLFMYSLVCLLLGFLDIWMLQYFAGNVQQGFFGLTVKIGTICFVFTSAMTPLITREFSIAHHKNDMSKLRDTFHRYVPIFFALASFIACFVAVQSKEVVLLFGGENYSHAIWPMTIMAFYPIYQTFCQLTGSIYFATGKTKAYRNIGISASLIGLPITYVLLSPCFFNLGAFGLAFKTLITAIIAGNMMVFFTRKLLNVKLAKFIFQQIATLGVLILLAWLSSWSSRLCFTDSTLPFLLFVISGIVYMGFVMLVCLFAPGLLGIRKEDVRSFISLVYSRLNALKS